MITAKDAKQLYDKSGVEVENFLTHNVEKEVINAAKSGKRNVNIHLGTLTAFEYVDGKTTPFNRAVVDKLKSLGYAVSIQKYGESYVPRGLADDDGNGPAHTNYGFVIGW